MKRKRSISWDPDIGAREWRACIISAKKGEIIHVFGKEISGHDIWVHILSERYYTEESYFKEKAYLSKKLFTIDIKFKANVTEDIALILDNEDSIRTEKQVSVKISISNPIPKSEAAIGSSRTMLEQMKEESSSNHLYLENEVLSDLSRNVIMNAEYEIIAVNPYVDKGTVTRELAKASKAGVDVTIITRNPKNERSMSMTKRKAIFP